MKRRRHLRFGALLAVIAGGHAVHGAEVDTAPFLGIWTLGGDSQVAGECVGVGKLPTQGLDGTRVSIYPGGTSSDIVFDIGCHCTVGLNVEGNRATIAPTPADNQPCSVVNRGLQINSSFTAFTLERTADGLSFSFAGAGGRLISAGNGCELGALSGRGALVRTGDGAVSCGAPDTQVGIVPIGGSSEASYCPLGAGRGGIRIETHDEDNPACSAETGGHGEGRWVLPDDHRKREPVCGGYWTKLDFCRVDGAQLGPLTTAADPSQYYAVLKLGSVCPNGSVEVRKIIDNEDDPQGARSVAIGDIGPNEVQGEIGTVTTLSFCYFRSAATASDVMADFPDFGIPYAVFHRYTGEQPPWVLMRRWQLSNDEDGQTGVNHYESSDPAVMAEFEEVVENTNENTIYNHARVR